VIRITSTPARATGAPQDSNFTRNATGLVREVSMWDALIMNTLGMNVAVGSVLLLQQAPAIFPGGNLVLAVIIAAGTAETSANQALKPIQKKISQTPWLHDSSQPRNGCSARLTNT